jgi:parvulin-like peptidyl-prolyl isomerase
VRSFCSHIARFILLVVLLAGCASKKSSDDSAPPVGNGSNNGGAGAVDQSAGQVAALVNGQPITMAAFERERARRMLGMDAQPATDATFDRTVLDSMIDQVLIEQAAERDQIVVTDAEINAELANQAEIAAANGTSLDQFIADQLYTMDEYREAMRGMLLMQKVSQQVVANVPTTTTQVHARHILVADEATARTLLDQLNQGADFAQLAQQYSLDKSTAPTGGDLDWVSRGDLLQPEVEEAIFALEPGTRAPEPVRSSLGYHIVETLERVEDRPLDQAKLAEKKNQAFLAWLQSQRDTAVIQRFVGVGSQ